MSELPPRKSASAGGFFMAILTLVGTIAGGVLGQPSIGLLTGLGLGTAIAILIWWKERAR